jgi:phage-related protein
VTDLSLRYLLYGEDKTASSTIGKVGGAFSKMGSTIGGEFGEVLNKIGEGIDHVGEHAKNMGAKLTAGGGIATGIGAALSFIGSADKQAADQLKAAVVASGHDYEEYAHGVEEAIKTQENFGHSAVDTQTALRRLTQATNDPKKALDEMGLVANLAAAKHISLADAAGLVAKVIGGKGSRTLAEFGIHMQNATAAANQLHAAEKAHETAVTSLSKAQQHLSDLEAIDHAKKKLTIADQIALRNAHQAVADAQAKVTSSTKDLSDAEKANKTASGATTDALGQLAQKTDGQAKASVDNFGAKIGILKTKLEDWTAVMGQKLGPVLTAVGPALMVVGSVMEIMRARQMAAAAATAAETAATEAQTIAQGESKLAMIGGAIATGAITVATGAWTAAQWLLNTALDANPIALVVIGIAALVAGIIYAYKHSETFREIVQGAFHAIGEAFSWAWDLIKGGFGWLKEHWPLVLAILTGPIGIAVYEIAKHWDTIVGFVTKLPGRIASAASGMWDGIKDAFRAAINWIIKGWNSLHFKMPSIDTHIPGVGKVGGFDLGLPQIPYLADGGTALSGGWAVVGERGPELINLNRGATVQPLTGRNAPRGGGDVYVTVEVRGSVTAERDLARSIRDEIAQLIRRRGGDVSGLGLAQ